jgi:hypothetical protein
MSCQTLKDAQHACGAGRLLFAGGSLCPADYGPSSTLA